jgi:calcineurin-like phosphoesterase family protein
MSETFFGADHHFFHKGILSYETESRPFSCVEEMNEAIIDRHNKVVGKNDTVIMPGDIVMGARNMPIIGRLNGSKKLIMGNHDQYDIREYMKYFTKVYGAYQYHSIIITHIPVHPDQLEKRFWANVHGHYHSRKFDRQGKRYVNVSLDALPNLTPIPYDEILNIATAQEGAGL